jgi:hypothetical protein
MGVLELKMGSPSVGVSSGVLDPAYGRHDRRSHAKDVRWWKQSTGRPPRGTAPNHRIRPNPDRHLADRWQKVQLLPDGVAFQTDCNVCDQQQGIDMTTVREAVTKVAFAARAVTPFSVLQVRPMSESAWEAAAG